MTTDPFRLLAKFIVRVHQFMQSIAGGLK